MNLDDFVSGAIKQVRTAKKQGKEGSKARKALRQSTAKLETIKAEIRATALACERREWKETSLIMYKTVGTCKCCGESKQTCHGALHLEKTHRKLGKLITKIENPSINAYPSLPRRVETLPDEDYICAKCFLAFDPAQPDLFADLETSPDCRPDESKAKKLFHDAEERFRDTAFRELIRKHIPSRPLLTHNPKPIGV